MIELIIFPLNHLKEWVRRTCLYGKTNERTK